MKQQYKWAAALCMIIIACSNPAPRTVLNGCASVSNADQLPENPLELIAITSSINPPAGTMSTLYGNKVAAAHAAMTGTINYPKNALLYEVTWKQQPDAVWFGANTPKQIIKVERIYFPDIGAPDYECYQGKPLRLVSKSNDQVRIKQIVSQRMAFSP